MGLPKDYNYSPLPGNLELKESKIHGLGIHSTQEIHPGEILGMSHIKVGSQLIRTPLGGYLNHSDEPNCRIMRWNRGENTEYDLVTMDYIDVGEELTLDYNREYCGTIQCDGKDLT